MGSTPVRAQPLRTCVACRGTKTKRQLIRIVRTPDGRLEIDLRGKQNGRGAYLCQVDTCWEIAQRRRALDRGLGIRLNSEDWQRLLKESAMIRA